MDIHVDGYRSTNENWIYAQNVASQKLPPLSLEEQEVAEQLGLSPEEYSRSKFAGDITRGELKQRAEIVGRLVSSWLERNGASGTVLAVWLKTFEGKFRVEVEVAGRSILCFVNEDVIDGILGSGSLEAERQLERLLEASFGVRQEARAS